VYICVCVLFFCAYDDTLNHDLPRIRQTGKATIPWKLAGLRSEHKWSLEAVGYWRGPCWYSGSCYKLAKESKDLQVWLLAATKCHRGQDVHDEEGHSHLVSQFFSQRGSIIGDAAVRDEAPEEGEHRVGHGGKLLRPSMNGSNMI
jgi:hypothetical protein